MVTNRMGREIAIPDHVPPELVFDTGHMSSPEYFADPYAYYASVHDKYPRLFFEIGGFSGGSWVSIKHADMLQVLRNDDALTIETTGIFPRDPDPERYFHLIPQELDPPVHRKYRSVLDPYLSPKAVLSLEKDIRALANELIDKIIDKGGCEFGAEFARPLPVTVFLRFMGLPLDMTDQFVKWVVSLIQFADRDKAVRIMSEIEAYLTGVIEEKRRKPDEGAISRIVHGRIDGEPLKERDVYGFTFFLFIAGIDTVFAALNNTWVWMARNPERRREMIADPGNIDRQVEELLRMFGVTFSGRLLKKDYELAGVRMKKGDRIMALLPAGNYDPDVFPEPREVRFDRKRTPILSFTGGVHACMGAHLARLEFKIAIQEWLRRIPDFEIAPGEKIVYPPSGVVGPERVPLVW